ncbi:MAG: L-histidine N(alpha)-methyltransferase, partial [Flavobacteriales bacterium]
MKGARATGTTTVPASVPKQADPVASEFRTHVFAGLAGTPKKISSRFFYDAEGDRLFQRIMASADYYVTRAEDEILREQT